MSDQKITTFFMFNGKAEEAIRFYTSLFEQSEIKHVFHQQDGTVMHAAFTLKGQTFMAIDNSNKDEHPFTPAISLFVECEDTEEINRVFERLTEGGVVLMPLAPLPPMSERFGWVQDKFGVSWQLSVRKKV
ncbi:VOC family protein [Paenibacillus sp. FJAT-27812]|uniref:VOC family protein n=1 Tax=Paenibacillus sp. FJAT-27812 TaxID=1684143 RepID=UPI0006A7E7F6|nr:VOC family protein [Paenibacillus sp. FJAT-27812]